jgi:predicted 3-demethylubiquinone-9 3-methyltransferase (glyoxalase superfamily)
MHADVREDVMSLIQKVSTCFWFDKDGEDAAKFYVSLLPNSRITAVSRYGKGAPLPEGTALTVTFELAGTEFMALNGGPHFKLTEAASLVVQCDGQAEIDRLWSALLADGGKEQQCGWLKDRYGMSWQIVPARLRDMMQAGEPERMARVMAAVMKMVKLDLAPLEAAYKNA